MPRGGGGSRTPRGGGGANKASKIRDMKNDVGTVLLRFNAVPNASPAITRGAGGVLRLSQLVGSHPDSVIKVLVDEPGLVTDDSLAKMLEVTSASNNLETRCSMVAEILFDETLVSLDEVKQQNALAVKVLKQTVQMAMVSQFGDATANISWVDFIKMVAKSIKERAEA